MGSIFVTHPGGMPDLLGFLRKNGEDFDWNEWEVVLNMLYFALK